MTVVEVPSFFKKADFYGVLLPGYLTVGLYILLFHPAVLFNPAQSLSIDLFSAVVFVIFGPAVGLGLQQFHRRLAVVFTALRPARVTVPQGASVPPPPAGVRTREYYIAYANVRLTASVDEKAELDLAESQYDFSMSAGIALAGLGIYRFFTNPYDAGTAFVLILIGIIFLLGGYVEWKYGFWPVMARLFRGYG